MIKQMEIKNFKSIKDLTLDCKRINIFIGEPNTGKSNIMEALGIFSYGCYYRYGSLRNFVRFERVSHLLYDENLDEPIRISLDDIDFDLSLIKEGMFVGKIYPNKKEWSVELHGNYGDITFAGGHHHDKLIPFKYYKFAVQNEFPRPESDFLLPPSGTNLMSLIRAHKELQSLANEIFSPFGLKLGLRPQEYKIEVIKALEPTIISYPYSLVSDTLQRLIFHLAAILSNKDSVLVFEEPESHAFPWHTKYLAETIALDKGNNQYFISTHNPYFLLPVLEKSPKEDVAIRIIYYEEYQTKQRLLKPEEMDEIMQIDVFSNLNRYRET